MLKWVHYCPLPKDRAIVPSNAKVIVPSETTRDEKDERRIYERRKYGADTGNLLNTRNAKIATPDAIMRRYFRFGVRSKGSRTWKKKQSATHGDRELLPMYIFLDHILFLFSSYFVWHLVYNYTFIRVSFRFKFISYITSTRTKKWIAYRQLLHSLIP